jgi:hypothetical protein
MSACHDFVCIQNTCVVVSSIFGVRNSVRFHT